MTLAYVEMLLIEMIEFTAQQNAAWKFAEWMLSEEESCLQSYPVVLQPSYYHLW